MGQLLKYKIPEPYEEYITVTNDILTRKGLRYRNTDKYYYFINITEIKKKIDHLLECEHWSEFEKKLLIKIKDIFCVSKFTTYPLVSTKDAQELTNLLIESFIERLNMVHQEIVISTFKGYSEMTAKIIMALDLNLDILKLIKNKKLKGESTQEDIDNLTFIVKNILTIIGILTEKIDIETIEEVLDSSSIIYTQYHSVEELLIH